MVVMWNPHMFDVNILHCDSQMVHCHVNPKCGNLVSYALLFMVSMMP